MQKAPLIPFLIWKIGNDKESRVHRDPENKQLLVLDPGFPSSRGPSLPAGETGMTREGNLTLLSRGGYTGAGFKEGILILSFLTACRPSFSGSDEGLRYKIGVLKILMYC